MVSEPIPDPGVGVYLVVGDVPHRIWEKVSGVIYVETPLNQVDTF